MAALKLETDLKKLNQQFGNNLQIFSSAVNGLAKAPHSLPIEERDRLNQLVGAGPDGTDTHNIARLPDDSATTSLTAAGASLHSIGVLLAKGVHDPHSPAVLARNVLECSAKSVSLSLGDGVERIMRTVKHLIKDLQDDGQSRPDAASHKMLLAYQDFLQQATRDKKFNTSKVTTKFSNLVAEMLEEIDGKEFYRLLSPFAHANIHSSMTVFVGASVSPARNYVETFNIALMGMHALFFGAQKLFPHRTFDWSSIELALEPLRADYAAYERIQRTET